jgi:hypothetical protein
MRKRKYKTPEKIKTDVQISDLFVDLEKQQYNWKKNVIIIQG